MPKTTLLLALLALGACARSGGDSGPTHDPHADGERDMSRYRNRTIDDNIMLLQQLVSATEVTDPDYPEFLLRLAGLHMEYRDYSVGEAQARHSRLGEARTTGDHDAAQQIDQERRTFDTRAHAQAQDAIKILQVLVDKPLFGTYARRDEALHWLAEELERLKRYEAASQIRVRLRQEYPDSRFVTGALRTVPGGDPEPLPPNETLPSEPMTAPPS